MSPAASAATDELLRDLAIRFTYHAPHGTQPERFVEIRDAAHTFAQLIVAHVPLSREQALALTRIEEAVMWANAGIARRERIGESDE